MRSANRRDRTGASWFARRPAAAKTLAKLKAMPHMSTLHVIRNALAVTGMAALVTLGACNDYEPTAPTGTPSVGSTSISTLLSSADLVVPGVDAGAFTNAIVADESGWTTTEFWDNTSNDGSHCNIGFYALGTINPACLNAAPGSFANRGGGYTNYWGDGPDHRQASSFMFSGSYGFLVTLRGSYARESSELGWFTVTGGVYSFHPVAGWSSKTINSAAIIHPAGGENWGLYIKHAGHPAVLTCAVGYDCSDATGDIHSGIPPVQQFALMRNADGTRYLVGIEDNAEETVAIPGDDDFNDFLLSVELMPVPQFVIGDVEAHDIGDVVNFWGSQWWMHNGMSGIVSNGVAAFKGYAPTADNFCGGSWSSLPGNSSNPPAVIPENVAIIVTSTVLKNGPAISGDIAQILIVHQDGGYGPNPGHQGNGTVVSVACPLED
jgi:hypothetical protein